MNPWDRFTILTAKIIGLVIRSLRLGSGATWPGEIALRMNPGITKKLFSGNRRVIIVAGTNGKTTTSKMLSGILKSAGHKVKRNESGANLENGIVSALIADTNPGGLRQSDTFIFEVDEASLPVVLRAVSPDIIILLNLFRDQLDRYGEIDTIARKWNEALADSDHNAQLIFNADDPFIASITRHTANKSSAFGLEDPKYAKSEIEHAADTVHCPSCGNRLTFGMIYFSHLGKWACGKCGLTHPDVVMRAGDFRSPLEGVYNIYNTMAAALAARVSGVSDEIIKAGFSGFTPAFGRMEEISYRAKTVKVLLSKNPAGMNESLRTVLASVHKGPLLLMLNDRIPDGTDVSWIWDVDFEMLKTYPFPIYVTGDRYLDLAVRLKYAGIPKAMVTPVSEYSQALHDAADKTDENGCLWVMPTYTAMLDARKHLVGRKIL